MDEDELEFHIPFGQNDCGQNDCDPNPSYVSDDLPEFDEFDDDFFVDAYLPPPPEEDEQLYPAIYRG